MRDRTEDQINREKNRKIRVVLIRHGKTQSNSQHRYLGRTEEPLSEEGWQELLYRKEAGSYPAVDRLYCSPMQRCLETAGILYPERAACRVEEFREMDFGAFEGKNYQELQNDPRYQAWIDSNGTLPFPDGESREAFLARCEKGFEEVLESLKEPEIYKQTMLELGEIPDFISIGLVVHGGTIMALCSQWFGGDYFDYQVENGGGYICILQEVHGMIEFVRLQKL